jgi:hypothetical protein
MSKKVLLDTNVITTVLIASNARSASAKVLARVLEKSWQGVFGTAASAPCQPRRSLDYAQPAGLPGRCHCGLPHPEAS